MKLETAIPHFTIAQIERLATLILCLSAIGSQLLFQRSKLYGKACADLTMFRSSDKELLETVHALALKNGAMSALRLSEDLERCPTGDTVQAIILAHRCMLATGFLAHCIAMSGKQASSPAMGVSDAGRVH
jgi:hypothetical protein